MKNLKFATKFLLVILGVSIISLAAIMIVSYAALRNQAEYSQKVNSQLGVYASESSRDALIRQAESYLSRLSHVKADKCNETLSRIQSHVVALAGYMEDLYRNPDNFRGRKLPLPNEVSVETAMAAIMVPQGMEITPEIEREMLLVSNAEYLAARTFSIAPFINVVYLGTETAIHFRYSREKSYDPDYDPRKRPWYLGAYDEDGPVWITPYVDAFNGEICTTCSKAYKDADGQIVGVAAIDILLPDVISGIINLRIGETGHAFLLDGDSGNYIAHPRYSELDTNAFEHAQGDYKDVLTSMVAGESGVRRVSIDGVEYYMGYAPLTVTGWSLGIVVEYDEIIAGALTMEADIDRRAAEADGQIHGMLNRVILRFIELSGVVIIVVLAISIYVSRSITGSIVKLTRNVIEVGKGNLDSKIEIRTKDEIGILADCFNKMTDDLKDYIKNLSKMTVEKEYINSELRIATDIQADMLPKMIPPFVDRDDFQLAAFMLPAKQVGGDFYDFFFLDEEQTKIALIIADVSGKGVPAALFMVIAKILIKDNKNLPAHEVLETVNDLLSVDNTSAMFVTTYYSVLDLVTGQYTYVCAGHDPPILYRKSDHEVSYICLARNPPLAVFPDHKFAAREITLHKGDSLLLYTDGVTEAFNRHSELYGTKRLLKNVEKLADKPVETIVQGLYRTVNEFADGEPQSDDITMLCCRFLGRDER